MHSCVDVWTYQGSSLLSHKWPWCVTNTDTMFHTETHTTGKFGFHYFSFLQDATQPAAQNPSGLTKALQSINCRLHSMAAAATVGCHVSGELNTALLRVFLSEKKDIVKDFLKVIVTMTVWSLVSQRSWARETRSEWWDCFISTGREPEVRENLLVVE